MLRFQVIRGERGIVKYVHKVSGSKDKRTTVVEYGIGRTRKDGHVHPRRRDQKPGRRGHISDIPPRGRGFPHEDPRLQSAIFLGKSLPTKKGKCARAL